MANIINSRSDLESLRGTPAFAETMMKLAGSMTIRVDTAEYPEGYGEPDYAGETITPMWEAREDLTTITRLGFTKTEFEAEMAATTF